MIKFFYEIKFYTENKWIVTENSETLPPGSEQDPDVLDTWFSSALIPLACAGWPEKLDSDFYPLSLMETGNDILKFWVNSMALLGLKLTNGKLPFNKILLHGLIRDAHGRKMSKSLGNVVDPRTVISGESQAEMIRKLDDGIFLTESEKFQAAEGIRKDFPKGIPECGADALRFSLLSQNLKQRDINFNVANCFHYRTFCNKIWQAFGFMSKKKFIEKFFFWEGEGGRGKEEKGGSLE